MVGAGAGSGKTFLLVKKIGDLFSGTVPGPGRVGVENVLALTFTRKAAGEMRTKVYRELLDRIDRTSPGPVKDHLLITKDHFHAVKISTIHGFAAAAIRNHPVEVGIDPEFVILDDASESALISSVVRAVLRDQWKENDTDLRLILELWEPFQVRRQLEGLLRKPIELAELIHTLRNENILELLAQVQARKWYEFHHRVNQPRGWLDQLGSIAHHCEGILADKSNAQAVRERKEKARRIIADFVHPLRELLAQDALPDAQALFFDELKEKLKEIGRIRWPDANPTEVLTGLKSEFVPWFQPLDQEKPALGFIEDFVRLAERAGERCEEVKRRRAAVVHDDLLIIAYRLAQSHPNWVRGAVDYFLIDEFQDTDPLQWETILSLSLAPDGNPRNLFLVGDTKQAIYAFRGADHTVTETAREILNRARGRSQIEHTLSENFRSLETPLAFTNALFDRLFAGEDKGDNPYAVPPQPLTAMREATDADSCAQVVVLVTDSEEKNTNAQESRSVVSFLKAIAEGQIQEFAPITDLMRKGEPAVGILFRTYAPMTDYIAELLRLGLSFSVYHGRTFFETPEVQTLENLLSWLADPGDEPAAAGVLRSPLFAWTDEELVPVFGRKRDSQASLEKLLQRVAEDAGEPEELRAKAQVAWKTLSNLRSLAAHVSLSETLRAALDKTIAPLIFGRGRRGSQADANIEKFLALVRELEISESASAQTVLKAVLDIRDAGPGEAEAESPTDERGTIQLMTIHAAKGLEFPMVITACCGRRSGGTRPPFSKRISYVDPQAGDAPRRITLAGIDYPDPRQDMQVSPTILSAFIKEHDQLQRDAEEKRLLYVTLTRARDSIVIPLPIHRQKAAVASKSHLDLILQSVPGLEEAALHQRESMDFQGVTIRLLHQWPGDGQDAALPAFDVDGEQRIIESTLLPKPQPLPQIGEMPYPRRTRVSVTELMTFSLCPRRFYYEKYFAHPALTVSGIAGGAMDQFESSERSPASVEAARILGTMVHKVLESCEADVAAWKVGQPPPVSVVERLEALAHQLRPSPSADLLWLRAAALRHVENAARCAILRGRPDAGASPGLPVLREVPFELERDGFIITGVIDRLAQQLDGSWRLWDYKTSSIDKRSREEVVRESAYDVQVRIYAWAAGLILGQPISEAGLVFTSATEDQLFQVSVEPDMVESTVAGLLDAMSRVLDGSIAEFGAVQSSELCSSCACRDLELC